MKTLIKILIFGIFLGLYFCSQNNGNSNQLPAEDISNEKDDASKMNKLEQKMDTLQKNDSLNTK